MTYEFTSNSTMYGGFFTEIMGNKILNSNKFYSLADGEELTESGNFRRQKLNDELYIQRNAAKEYGVYRAADKSEVHTFTLDYDASLGRDNVSNYTSPANKYFLFNFPSDSLHLYNIDKKEMKYIPNFPQNKYRWLNEDYLYYSNDNYKDTIFIKSISTNEEKTLLRRPKELNKSNIASDANFVYYFDYELRKLRKVSLADLSETDIDLDYDLSDLKVSFDQKYLFGIGADGAVLIYSLTDFSLVRRIIYHGAYLNEVILSSDNKYLLYYDSGVFLCFYLETLSVEEETKSNKTFLKIYPNPAENHIKIENAESSLDIPFKAEIYSAAGSLLYEGSSNGVIDITFLPAGTYYLKQIYDNYTVTGKFVKK